MGHVFSRWRSATSAIERKAVVLRSRKLTIVKLLAEGGFSAVFLVRDTATKEVFALKRLLLQLEEHEDLFVTEVGNHRRVQHPCVCPIIDSVVRLGRGGRKEGLILLPFYEKGSLQNLVDRGDVDLSHVLKVFLGACRGVEAFHRLPEPYAVRDIKPANIMIDAEGNGVLIDLGSAGPARVRITNRKEALQLQESCEQNVTALYRNPPFDGSATAALSGSYPLPTTPVYPAFVKELIGRMLQVDITARPDIADVIAAVQAAAV